MTWVAWRVQRTPSLVAAIVVAAGIVWLVASSVGALSGWAETTNHGADVVLYVLPGLLGLALGAPLVALESDHGTARLAFTQSVSRSRWLASKLFVGALVSVVLMAVLTPLCWWWARAGVSHETAIYIQPKVFAVTGIVSLGYVLFAFVLGALLGASIGRAGWAFALGVPIVVALRLMVEALRSSLVAPALAVMPSSSELGLHGVVLNSAFLPVGQTTPAPGQTWAGEWSRHGTWNLMRACAAHAPGQGSARGTFLEGCARSAHLRLVVQYQPESHYWALQGAESALFVALALALVVPAFIAVRRRQA